MRRKLLIGLLACLIIAPCVALLLVRQEPRLSLVVLGFGLQTRNEALVERMIDLEGTLTSVVEELIAHEEAKAQAGAGDLKAMLTGALRRTVLVSLRGQAPQTGARIIREHLRKGEGAVDARSVLLPLAAAFGVDPARAAGFGASGWSGFAYKGTERQGDRAAVTYAVPVGKGEPVDATLLMERQDGLLWRVVGLVNVAAVVDGLGR